MAPFPEDEIMTIKRLEVALRKSDFKLLKEGAYKLHEKYHSNHHFEYLDLLRDILEEVQTNYIIPHDITSILIPTIQDILSNSNHQIQDEPQRVSSLTSMSYGLNNQDQIKKPMMNEQKPQIPYQQQEELQPKRQEEYIKPFMEFTPIRPPEANNQIPREENIIQEEKDYTESIVNTYNEPIVEDFITENPIMQQQNIFEIPKEDQQEVMQEIKEPIQQKQDIVNNIMLDVEKEPVIKPVENNIENNIENIKQIPEEKTEEIKEDPIPQPEEIQQTQVMQEVQEVQAAEEIKEAEPQKKSIVIFYGQDFSNEKTGNILNYRELIHSNKNIALSEIISLINEIKTQADTNVSELQLFLDKLKTTNHNINLITSSQSANLIDLLAKNDISYSIFNPSDEIKINLLPLFGLTNLYKCFECNNEYLEKTEEISSFILQCPKCKNAMLPDLYSANGELNMDYYNSSVIALANSDTWLLIHPSLNEKLTLNMMRSAMKVSSKAKEVYILDKDINVRETYKKLFEDINPDIKVCNDLNVIEDFLNNI